MKNNMAEAIVKEAKGNHVIKVVHRKGKTIIGWGCL
jgi:hypothetical protein